MRENSSPQPSSTPGATGPADAPTTTPLHTPSVVVALRSHRAWRRITVGLASLLTAGFLAGGVAPASASSSVNLITTASSNTVVGRQIFGNVNLMNATVTPTGTVTFRLYSPADTNCTWPIFTSTVAVTGQSMNSSIFRSNQAGTYRWRTSYSGDANYYAAGPTPCSSPSADVIVSKARNVLQVFADAPSGGTLSASASLNGGYYPNGTITFSLTGPDDTWCSTAPVYTVSVPVNGAGTYTTPDFVPAATGDYTWRAKYSGDSDNLATSITACLYSSGAVDFTG